MKKLLLLVFVVLVGVFLFVGCIAPTVPSDVPKVLVEITGFKQEAFCGAGAKAHEVFNGKCGPYCPPCDCEECQECETCEECQECEICEQCEQCQECQECEQQECPTCPTCGTCPCYSLQWGKKLWVYFRLENEGEDDVIVDQICSIIITFEGGKKVEKQISMEDTLLVGEEKNKEIEINLVTAERVIFVEIKKD